MIRVVFLSLLCATTHAFISRGASFHPLRSTVPHRATAQTPTMAYSGCDLTGKVAFIAGVADSNGYGWAIAKALADAGATITVGTW